ncbi:hypothetical protein Pla163_02640 [Planctomycetes bacterium Pla163]|uniref:DoxX n=1 Tax=Rohdeia mirabilis TaxID=2528008 RepID=A0A518CVB0_9BACT|nr:hypothetical protein Pla163_02640 [Planctomycetes bacterium Pla163]
MEFAFEICRVLSIVAFAGYGLACVFGGSMEAEFERFGLARFRVLTGVMETLGALGLLGGYLFPPLTLLAAGGLTALMVLGVGVRIRAGDGFVATLPATILLGVNGFLVVAA